MFLSTRVGRLIIVENIGLYGLARSGAPGSASLEVQPTLLQGVAFLWQEFSRAPVNFTSEHVGLVLGMFQLGGGRWLEVHGNFPTATWATLAKLAAHLFADLPQAAIWLAAPFGAAVARRRDVASVLGLWIGLHLVLTSLSGYSGQRFREPIDGAMLVFAACLLARGRRQPSRFTLFAAAAAAVAVLVPILRTVPSSLAARSDYGIGPWVYTESGRWTTALNEAGFNAFPANGRLEWIVRSGRAGAVGHLKVWVDGYLLEATPVGPLERGISVVHRGLRAFVELEIRPLHDVGPVEIVVLDYPARRGR